MQALRTRGLRATIESALSEFAAERRFPGSAVAIRIGGELIESVNWGEADARLRGPVRASTAFAIGSITKVFIAAGIMRLVDEHTIDLRTEMCDLVPECSRRSPPLCIEHLLNHTGGLQSRADKTVAAGLDATPEELLQLLNGAPSIAAPGAKWQYSSTGYFLLATVIERATGCRFRDYIRLQFLEPLALEDTFFLDDTRMRSAAIGHAWTGDAFATVDPPSSASYGSGDLYSTAVDLTKWMDALAGGFVISADSLRAMTSPAVLASGESLSCGCGLFVATHHGHVEWSHDGSTAGFSGQLAHYPRERLSLAVLSNGSDHCAEEVEKRITASLLFWENDVEKQSIDRSDLSTFVGAYAYGSSTITVSAQQEGLVIGTPSGRQAQLAQVAPNEFEEIGRAGLTYQFAPS